MLQHMKRIKNIISDGDQMTVGLNIYLYVLTFICIISLYICLQMMNDEEEVHTLY